MYIARKHLRRARAGKGIIKVQAVYRPFIAKRALGVMKKQGNEPPINHGGQGLAGDVSSDRVEKTTFILMYGQGVSPPENTSE